MRRRRHFFAVLILALAGAYALASAAPAAAAPLPIPVNSTADEADSNPGDGVCQAFGGECTLRAAIKESNALPGADTIVIAAGVYELEIPTLNDDLADDRRLRHPRLRDDRRRRRAAAATIIDGGFPPTASPIEQRGMDRLFEIHPTARQRHLPRPDAPRGLHRRRRRRIQNWSPGLRPRSRTSTSWTTSRSSVGGGINNADPSRVRLAADRRRSLPPRRPRRDRRLDALRQRRRRRRRGDQQRRRPAPSPIDATARSSDNPGQMIPDPLRTREEIDPGPGRLRARRRAPIANQAEFDVVGTIHIVDSTCRGQLRAPTTAPASSNDGPRHPHRRALDDHATTRPRPTAAASTPPAATLTDHRQHDLRQPRARRRRHLQRRRDSSAIGLRSRVTITRARTIVRATPPSPPAAASCNDGDAAAHAHRRRRHLGQHGRATPAAASATTAAPAWPLTRVTFTDNETQRRGRRRLHRQRAARDDHGLRCSPATRPACPRSTTGRPIAGDVPSEPSRQHRRRRRPLHRGRPGRRSPARPFTGQHRHRRGRRHQHRQLRRRATSPTASFRDNQRRRRRRRHREQRHARHLRAAAGHRTTGRRSTAAASTTRRATSSSSSTRPIERNSALDGGGLANAPDNDLDHPRRRLPRQHRAHARASPRTATSQDGGARRRLLQPGRRRRA